MDECKEMVCNGCFKSYTLYLKTFREAEKRPCPYCGSTDTTPMLNVRVGKQEIRQFVISRTD